MEWSLNELELELKFSIGTGIELELNFLMETGIGIEISELTPGLELTYSTKSSHCT